MPKTLYEIFVIADKLVINGKLYEQAGLKLFSPSVNLSDYAANSSIFVDYNRFSKEMVKHALAYRHELYTLSEAKRIKVLLAQKMPLADVHFEPIQTPIFLNKIKPISINRSTRKGKFFQILNRVGKRYPAELWAYCHLDGIEHTPIVSVNFMSPKCPHYGR